MPVAPGWEMEFPGYMLGSLFLVHYWRHTRGKCRNFSFETGAPRVVQDGLDKIVWGPVLGLGVWTTILAQFLSPESFHSADTTSWRNSPFFQKRPPALHFQPPTQTEPSAPCLLEWFPVVVFEGDPCTVGASSQTPD